MKKLLVALAIAILVLVAIVGWNVFTLYRATTPLTAADDYARQDDSRVSVPAQQPHQRRAHRRRRHRTGAGDYPDGTTAGVPVRR